ncbi:LysR family transcriptional regulator [Caballeronia sp. 15711]|uniref:LysR family transcriptional regulator n=1 Tax=Caballeronia sp. 15711 TaxID=3391029 RepID=UPI0039E4E34B
MDLRRIDLNLLKVFESVYRLRSVTETAREISLTQPAVSHALSRLRETLDDPLFFRTSTGLEPTSRSHELAKPVKDALQILDDALMSSGGFEPLICKREFKLLLSDVGELIFVPRLLRYLQQHAPLARIDVIQASRTRYTGMLRDREADFAVGHLPKLGEGLKQRRLFEDRWVVMRRKASETNSSPGRPPLTLDAYAKALHVITDPPGTMTHPIDAALDKLHIARTVTVRMPHFFALPSVIRETDLLATVPRSMALSLRQAEVFDIVELPFEVSLLDVRMYWHSRQDSDPAMSWFRDVFVKLFSVD